MSRHSLRIEYQGRAVVVLAGWDRPSKGYFLSVDFQDVEDDDDDLIYSSQFDAELIPSYGFTPDLAYFAAQLATLQVPVPQRMLDELARDGRDNAGNRIVEYDVDGNVVNEQFV